MDRNEALKWLNENLKQWPEKAREQPPIGDWFWTAYVGEGVTLCNAVYRQITESDWSPVSVQNDQVNNPSHYHTVDNVEVIKLIASAMTLGEWRGFCLGNTMKYRMRAGKKSELQQDIDKANKYEELFEELKGLNRK